MCTVPNLPPWPANVRGRADEGERDEVDSGLECPVEVGEVLARERGDRDGDAREVDPLVRAHAAPDDDGAGRAPALDLVDAEPHEAVVDQDLVTGLEHVPDHRRSDGELPVAGGLLRANPDAVAGAVGLIGVMAMLTGCRRLLCCSFMVWAPRSSTIGGRPDGSICSKTNGAAFCVSVGAASTTPLIVTAADAGFHEPSRTCRWR